MFLDMTIEEKGKYIKVTNFPFREFSYDVKNTFNSSKISTIVETTGIFRLFGKSSILIHRFFLPEIVFILSKLPNKRIYSTLINDIMDKTWMWKTLQPTYADINYSKLSDIVYNLKPYQREFLDIYGIKKKKYNLSGYLLAFEQGLGKTITALSTMHCLNKDVIICIVPKPTINTVWYNEINTIFKQEQSIWRIGELKKQSRFYLLNYESIDKLNYILPFIIGKNVGIIVDECHNFRSTSAKRVINLLAIAKILDCKDILLLSGTPIKALGTEMIPTLQLIDPYFDEEAKDIFVRVFGLSSLVAIDILRNRLGLVMHRKTKEEVLKLPNKYREDIKIKFSDADEYTLDSVKVKVLKFINERNQYYKIEFSMYERWFNECISSFKFSFGNTEDFHRYLYILEIVKKKGYDFSMSKDITWMNKYEKDVLRPTLSNDLKKKFDKSRAVVKYLNLKIMGEVIGGLLSRLRAEMYGKIVRNSPTCDIIKSAKKKTLCYTTYVDVVKIIESHVKSCGYNPVAVYSETTGGDVSKLVNLFKKDPNINPLIATVQSLSVGQTLTEANTMIMVNKPWRYTDMIQTEDRCHRIGQTEDVYIYNYVLDTGDKPNLSTRMEDIVSWSKQLFVGIVGSDSKIQIQNV